MKHVGEEGGNLRKFHMKQGHLMALLGAKIFSSQNGMDK
jgi:hypothetical protein